MNPQNPQEPQQPQYAQPVPQVAQPTMQQPLQPTAGPVPYMQQPMQQPQAKSKLPLIIALSIVVVVLVAGAALLLLGKKDDKKSATSDTTNTTASTKDDTEKNSAVTPPKSGTADSRAQDTKVRASINSIHSKLEEYFNENNGYPATFSTTDDSTFPGIDTAWFTDSLGKKISVVAPVADKKAADLIAPPLSDGPLLQYIPYACKGSLCDKYILRGYIINTDTYGTNPYTKFSLN